MPISVPTSPSDTRTRRLQAGPAGTVPPGVSKRSRDAEHRLIVRRLTAVMLGRRSSTTDPLSEAAPIGTYDPSEPAGKGRPTPKRTDARKARRNAAPKNRKEAAALQRDKRRERTAGRASGPDHR